MKSSRASIASLMVLACISAAAILVARMHAQSAGSSTLIVKAVAHQWWWEFDYPSLGIKTSDVLYLPSATNVRLELASADVIHSFWIAGMKESVDILQERRARSIWSSSHRARSMEIAIPVVAVERSACDFACWRAIPRTLSSGRVGSV